MLRRWVDAFIAPSRYAARMLELIGIPRERVHLIHNGIDPMTVDDGYKPEFGLFVGRTSVEKGVPTLIRAAEQTPDVPIVAAGTGPLDKELATTQIRHLGQLDRRALQAIIAKAAFTVVPSSSHEAFPYVALESLAMSKPVIATRVGGLPEIVQPGLTGELVDPEDAPALAAAIRRLWRDPELATMLGAAGRELVREQFTLESQLDRTIELYETVRSMGRQRVP
jgi:glycosyltransferase involved in cell wall biosynthesis